MTRKTILDEGWTLLKVDFDTPLEEQLAGLMEDKLLRLDSWACNRLRGTYTSRHPGEEGRWVLLRERRFNRVFRNGQQMLRAIARHSGEKAADAYMLAAWLRHNHTAGRHYCLATLGDYRSFSTGNCGSLHVGTIGSERAVFPYWDEPVYVDDWVYLVSRELPPELKLIRCAAWSLVPGLPKVPCRRTNLLSRLEEDGWYIGSEGPWCPKCWERLRG